MCVHHVCNTGLWFRIFVTDACDVCVCACIHVCAGLWFREFVMDEIVKSIDALSRDQLYTLAAQLGLQGVTVPLLLPGAKRSTLPLTPPGTCL